MARLRRKGRILKWAGLFVSVFIAIVWTLTLTRILHHTTQTRLGVSPRTGRTIAFGRVFSLAHGSVSYRWDQGISRERGWWTLRTRFQPRWLPVVQPGLIVLPLWIPFVFIAVPTAYLWWRDRRIPAHCCQECGYNLTGNVSGICPECGKPLASNRGPD